MADRALRMMKTTDLIRYTVWYATQREIKLTTVRLVKFVYLADLFYARAHGGATLTGFPWAFVYYGPYCSEVMREIDTLSQVHGGICKQSFESRYGDKDFQLFTCNDPDAERLEDRIPNEVLYPLRESIRKFGEDTQALLDYVYFDTEPMEDVRKGEVLNFRKARPIVREKAQPLARLSKKDIQAAKHHISNLVGKMKKRLHQLDQEKTATSQFYDDIYFEALASVDEEDLETGLQGTARIVTN
jgi:hypothetical protein